MLNFAALIANEEDQKLVEQIFYDNAPKLYIIAYGLLHNHHDSEDCVDDVILVLIDKLQEYQCMSEMHQKNFLVKVCRCIAINKYKQNMRRNKYEPITANYGDEIISNLKDEDEDTVNIVIMEETRKILIKLIEDLDPKYGDILYLKYILEMKNIDIAKRLNMTQNHVNVNVSRGLAKLKSAFGGKISEIYRR